MNKKMFDFKVTAEDKKSRARTANFTLPRGTVQTPMFMPCGTKGMVKTMLPDELSKLGIQLMLGNTYHLFLRPGDKLIADKGGLPTWNRWRKPMLTDSGGFQVFSLGESRTDSGESLVKIDENGVEFRSYLDGSKHYFTPEKAIEVQYNIGADIIMAFDECADSTCPKDYARAAMQRTHNWWERCWETHLKLEANRPDEKLPQALFPIIQGTIHEDLRKESAKFLNSFPTHGIAIGGLAVGETKDIMYGVIDLVVPELDNNKPRYLMGVGSPEDLVEGVKRGIDMFDCVLPTRLARHGAYWDEYGRQNLKLATNINSDEPLMRDCQCHACKNFTRSFIRHLLVENEISALRLLTIHNLHYLMELMASMRSAIEAGDFDKFYENFYSKWGKSC